MKKILIAVGMVLAAGLFMTCDSSLMDRNESGARLVFNWSGGSRAATGDAQQGNVTITVTGNTIIPRSQDFTIPGGGVVFDELPIGETVTVSVGFTNLDGVKYAGSERHTIVPGANSVTVHLKEVSPQTEGDLTITVIGANEEFDNCDFLLTNKITGDTKRNATLAIQQIRNNVWKLKDIPIGTYTVKVTAYKGNDTYIGTKDDVQVAAGENDCEVTVVHEMPPKTSFKVNVTIQMPRIDASQSPSVSYTATLTYEQKGSTYANSYDFEFFNIPSGTHTLSAKAEVSYGDRIETYSGTKEIVVNNDMTETLEIALTAQGN